MPELKDIALWKEIDVQELPRGEYDWLEYKSSPWFTLDESCLLDLSKYISAFANYEGGYLVVGVNDPNSTASLALDGGVALAIKRDLKAWLEDKVPTLTDPPVNRLGVVLLKSEGPNSQIKSGHAIVIIRVPPSSDAPHQARDKKFYTRLGSKLAPLSTRAVLDVAYRIRHPKIQTELFINKHLRSKSDNLFWRVRNVSDIMARHVAVAIKCPQKMLGMAVSFEDGELQVADDKTIYWRLASGNHASTPLFPRASLEHKFPLMFSTINPNDLHDSIENIIVRTYADSMPFVEEIIEPRSIFRSQG